MYAHGHLGILAISVLPEHALCGVGFGFGSSVVTVSLNET